MNHTIETVIHLHKTHYKSQSYRHPIKYQNLIEKPFRNRNSATFYGIFIYFAIKIVENHLRSLKFHVRMNQTTFKIVFYYTKNTRKINFEVGRADNLHDMRKSKVKNAPFHNSTPQIPNFLPKNIES